ncbi:MAG: hypothetical protein WC659_02970 [Patescibacteria group bacterium]
MSKKKIILFIILICINLSYKIIFFYDHCFNVYGHNYVNVDSNPRCLRDVTIKLFFVTIYFKDYSNRDYYDKNSSESDDLWSIEHASVADAQEEIVKYGFPFPWLASKWHGFGIREYNYYYLLTLPIYMSLYFLIVKLLLFKDKQKSK